MSASGPSLQSQVINIATIINTLNTLYIEMTTRITTSAALSRASTAYDRELAAFNTKVNQLINKIKSADNIDELKKLDFSSIPRNNLVLKANLYADLVRIRSERVDTLKELMAAAARIHLRHHPVASTPVASSVVSPSVSSSRSVMPPSSSFAPSSVPSTPVLGSMKSTVSASYAPSYQASRAVFEEQARQAEAQRLHAEAVRKHREFVEQVTLHNHLRSIGMM